MATRDGVQTVEAAQAALTEVEDRIARGDTTVGADELVQAQAAVNLATLRTERAAELAAQDADVARQQAFRDRLEAFLDEAPTLAADVAAAYDAAVAAEAALLTAAERFAVAIASTNDTLVSLSPVPDDVDFVFSDRIRPGRGTHAAFTAAGVRYTARGVRGSFMAAFAAREAGADRNALADAARASRGSARVDNSPGDWFKRLATARGRGDA